MRTLLLLVLAVPALAQPAKQIVVEAVPGAASDGNLRMVPPLGHTKGVNAAALSPRGDLMLTGSDDTTARLWDVATGREVFTLTAKDSNVLTLAWSPDGKRALVGGNNFGVLYLWETATGRVVRQMKHPNDINSVAWSADGKRALTGCYDGVMRVWNLESGELVREMAEDPARSENARGSQRPIGAAWSADGKKAIGLTEDKRLTQHDVASGQLLSSQKLDFTPKSLSRNGKFAVGSTEESLILWDAEAAREKARFAMPPKKFDAATAGAISPDGKRIAAGTGAGELRVWEVGTGRLLATWLGHADIVTDVTWSDDSQFLTSAGFDKVTHLWKVAALQDEQKREVQTFRGYSLPIKKLNISPDGRSMLARTELSALGTVTGANTLQLSDIGTGRRLALWQVSGYISGLAFSRDSQRVLVATTPSYGAPPEQKPHLYLFDVAADAPIREYEGFSIGIAGLSFNADGSQFLAGGGDTVMRLWNVASAVPIAEFRGGQTGISNVAWSADGARATSLDRSGQAFLWDIASRRQLKQWQFGTMRDATPWLNTGAFLPGTSSFSNDGRFVFTTSNYEITKVNGSENMRSDLRVFDTETGSEAKLLGKENYAFKFSSDDKWIFNQDQAERVTQVWDAQSGAEITDFRQNKNRYLRVQANGSIVLSELGRSNALLTYLPMENGDWLAFTPGGLFDGSPGGIERVTFEKNGQTFALAQFAERFYRPGLVAQIMGGEDVPAPSANAAAVLTAGAPPLVKITSPKAGAAGAQTVEVTVTATAQNGGGVKAIRLYQNGRLVGGPGQLRGIVVEAATAATAPGTATGDGSKTQKFSVTLASGENLLRAVAYSQTDLESAPDEVKLSFAGASKKPALYVLAVGINEYRDATMALTYARPDAESLVQFFRDAKNTSLFSSTNIVPLLDEAATGDAIKKSLSDIAAKSQPEDVVFIYLAGHGETAALDSQGDEDANAPQNFYFLPTEMRQMMKKDRVREFGVSGKTIDELVSKMPARKIVLVYDACKSGAAISGATRGAGDEQQALAQLARAQGIYVLTASTSQQYAGEVKALGHGILTYALLEGLGGKAADNDSTVKVSGLFAYTDDRVPALAKEYRGREQWPVSFGRGQNFPLVLK